MDQGEPLNISIMKKSMKMFVAGALMMGCVVWAGVAGAQAPPPPDPPGSHGGNTNQSPMGAPLDGGLAVFLAFAVGYGSREWLKRKQEG
jgi:hypothetical protein